MKVRIEVFFAVLLVAGSAAAANQQRVIVEQSGMNSRQTAYWAYVHSIDRPDVHLNLICNIGARRCKILIAGDEMNYEVSNEKKDQLYKGVNVALWGDEDEHYLLYGLTGSATY